MSTVCIGWAGECPINPDYPYHGCRFQDGHTGAHICGCGASTDTRPREFPVRPGNQKRDRTYYYPKYMRNKK